MKVGIKHNLLIRVLLVLCLVMQMSFSTAVTSNVKAEETDGPDPNFHIYIAFGQSNMDGNARPEEQDLIVPDDYLMMNTADDSKTMQLGKWYPAKPPLGRPGGGLGVADYFGRKMLELKKESNPNAKVGVIVVAVPGASIKLFDTDTYTSYLNNVDKWLKDIANNSYGGNPYKRIIDMAKIAQKDGVIKGILLHQGETDNGFDEWGDKVKKIYDAMIKDLDLGDNIPLLAGEVVRNDEGGAAGGINTQINNLPNKCKNFYAVSSKGFSSYHTQDRLHFLAEGYRGFGAKYAEKMFEVEPQYTFGDPVYEWSDDNTTVKASRVCNELSNLVEEETVNVKKEVVQEATKDAPGIVKYTTEDFKNPAFTTQTKTEELKYSETGDTPVDNNTNTTPTADPNNTSTSPKDDKNPTDISVNNDGSVGESTKISIGLSSVKCKKNAKKITGKVSESGVKVKIKVGNKAAKKATVKGKKFTLKLSYKLKKKTKITIMASKTGLVSVKKVYKVK